MADFTAKDVQALRQATRCRHDGRQASTLTDADSDTGAQVAA